jgi:hypothetical protein
MFASLLKGKGRKRPKRCVRIFPLQASSGEFAAVYARISVNAGKLIGNPSTSEP